MKQATFDLDKPFIIANEFKSKPKYEFKYTTPPSLNIPFRSSGKLEYISDNEYHNMTEREVRIEKLYLELQKRKYKHWLFSDLTCLQYFWNDPYYSGLFYRLDDIISVAVYNELNPDIVPNYSFGDGSPVYNEILKSIPNVHTIMKRLWKRHYCEILTLDQLKIHRVCSMDAPIFAVRTSNQVDTVHACMVDELAGLPEWKRQAWYYLSVPVGYSGVPERTYVASIGVEIHVHEHEINSFIENDVSNMAYVVNNFNPKDNLFNTQPELCKHYVEVKSKQYSTPFPTTENIEQYNYIEHNGCTLTRLVNPGELILEGEKMSNCIGGLNYSDYCESGNSLICHFVTQDGTEHTVEFKKRDKSWITDITYGPKFISSSEQDEDRFFSGYSESILKSYVEYTINGPTIKNLFYINEVRAHRNGCILDDHFEELLKLLRTKFPG